MNTHPIDRDGVTAFLASYVRAFNARDGAAIAGHYALPSLSLRGDGKVSILDSREQSEALFSTMAQTYFEQGCVDWRAANVKIHPIGSRSALVSVDWSMLRSDGSVIRSWRHSYNMLVDGGRLLILLATFNFA